MTEGANKAIAIKVPIKRLMLLNEEVNVFNSE